MKLLTVEETAKMLRLKVSTVYKYTSMKKLPFIKDGNRIIFDYDDLKNWINSLKVTPI